MRRHGTSRRGQVWTGAWRACGLALVLVAACARVFGIDDTPARAGAGAAGRAGSAARAGSGGAGRRSNRAGTSGGGTAGASHGGASHAGMSHGGRTLDDGGAGGDDTGGASGDSSNAGANGGSHAESGAGGMSDQTIDGVATLGAPCAVDSPLSCGDASPLELLRCRSGVWTYDHTCEPDYRCDPPTGSCVALDAHCAAVAPSGPVCDGSTVLDCGPDVWSAKEQVCPYGCRDAQCLLGSATQLTLHTAVQGPQSAWTTSIPVCLATADAAADAPLFDLVHSEVERVYNRFLSVEFVGWQSRCARGASGVIVSFAGDCSGHLVNDIEPVRPDSGARVPVTLCRSYFDSAGGHADASVSLLRLLARHQFGHVLGLVDGTDAQMTGMLRGVESGHEDELVLTAEDYVALMDVTLVDGTLGYPRKPNPSLVTTAGACVTPSALAPGAGVSLSTCDANTPAQRFGAVVDQIQSAGDSGNGYCFAAGAWGEPVSIAACALGNSPSEQFRLAHAQWRTPTQCVAPAEKPPVAGTRLLTEPCADVGDTGQAWWFEIVDRTSAVLSARIHFGDSEWCVAAPSVNVKETLELAACETGFVANDPQLFLLRADGSLSIGSLRMRWQDPAGLLYLDAEYTPYIQFFASGALEGSDGTALTVLSDSTLGTAPLAEPPAQNQTFDVYF